MTSQSAPPDWGGALALAEAHAPFLRGLLREHRQLPERLVQHGPDVAFAAILNDVAAASVMGPIGEVRRRLRLARSEAALIIALADLSGAWPLEAVTHALSRFADACIDVALRAALQPAITAGRLLRIDGTPVEGLEDSGLVCLAMGKLGGGELNYSSDVDLVFFFDEQLVTDRDGAVPTEVFIRIIQQFVALLQERTEDGYVLRVDLRLRPDPNATPVALSMAAAEAYYHSTALTWERAAFTRARVCAGDAKAAEGFMARMTPWIWRRSLDPAAIRDIHTMKDYVQATFDQQTADVPGFDVKRGLGGIREIEFLAQIQQLFFGGRRPELRAANTGEALAALEAGGLIDNRSTALLIDSYRFLRTTEHRIQMMHDEQTHVVPKAAAGRKALAALSGFGSREAFDQALARVTRRVHRLYSRLLGPSVTAEASDTPGRQGIPAALGAQATALIEGWQRGRYRAFRTDRARASLERLLPALLAGVAGAGDPPAALARLDSFFERLPSGVQFLELLEHSPPLLDLLVRTLTIAPALGEQLARTPALFDAVLDPGFFAPFGGHAALAQLLDEAVARGRDPDERIDHAARWTAEQRFRLGVLVIDRKLSAVDAAHVHARIADVVVARVTHDVSAQFIRAHGRIAGDGLAIVALGGWGGGQLLPGSDLDLVFVFDGALDAQSDGARPLPSAVYYNRLAQRVSGALTATRADGVMFEVDTRLRPSGAQGLLAVTLDSFLAYQRKDAWIWEHLALTRARTVMASAGFGERIDAGIRSVLATARNRAPVIDHVLEMRADMDRHRPPLGPWDMKLPTGGLIDLEFIVQTLLLVHPPPEGAAPTSDVRTAIQHLAAVGALRAADATALIRAWHAMLGVRVVLKLTLGGDGAAPTATDMVAGLLVRAMGTANWAAAQSRLAAHRQTVRRLWQQVLGKRR
jgi:glutamate-ammonia-ligase adenylyltransferase